MSHQFFLFSEISLPNEQARMDILKIHAGPITKHGEIGIIIEYRHGLVVLH